MPWHPPIPAEAVYRPEVATLGAGLRLLFYFYNSIGRDGEFNLSLTEATEALDVEYETLRKWWQAIKKTGIVTVVKDMGHNGLRVRMHRDWIDWHVQRNNFPADAQRENITVEDVSTATQPSLNGSSTSGQRENITVENNVYGTHDSHESPTPTSLKPDATNGHKPVPNREMVMMLMAKGVKSSKVANEIAMMGLDYGTVEQSIDNLLADNRTKIEAVIGYLRTSPPEPGRPYPLPRPNARSPAERVAQTVGMSRPPPAPADAVPAHEAAKRMLALRDQQRGVRPDDTS